jgi:dodecin
MSEHTYKMVELVGSSKESSDDAIRNAVARAGESIKHMRWFQVVEIRGYIDDGNVAYWQVTIKVGFTVGE